MPDFKVRPTVNGAPVTQTDLLAAAETTTPVDTDKVGGLTAAGILTWFTWANIKTFLSLTYVLKTAISAFGLTLVDDADAAAARTTLGLGTMAVAVATDYVINVGNTGNYYERYIAVVPDMTTTQVCTVDITTASTHRPVITHIRFHHDRGGAQTNYALAEAKVRWTTGASASNAILRGYELDYAASGTPAITLTAITNGIRLTIGSSAFGNTMTQGSVFIESTGEGVANLLYAITVT